MIPDADLKLKLKARLSASDERGDILHVQTVNHYFADNLSDIRQERVLARLEDASFEDGHSFDMAGVMERVHLSNGDQAVNDIHAILIAY